MQLKTIVKIIEEVTKKKTPVDIVEFLESDRYSKSKKDYVEIGSMDLFHLIRSMKKKENVLLTNWSDNAIKLEEIKEIIDRK